VAKILNKPLKFPYFWQQQNIALFFTQLYYIFIFKKIALDMQIKLNGSCSKGDAPYL
jgi:hypothetical protein